MTVANRTPRDGSVCTLWESPRRAAIVTRIAVAGDFLPAGELPSAKKVCWRDLAEPLRPHFADAATTFANLECAIGAQGLPSQPLNGIGQIVSAEPDALAYLAAIGCTTAGIANNHMYDFGPDGAARTRKTLLDREIVPLGAGLTLKDAPDVFIWHGPSDLRIGFWAAAKAARELASSKSAGIEPATFTRASQALAAMKHQGARVCVALIHAGCLRASRPSPEDAALLRSLACAGFDIVAASHSHRISGAEIVTRENGERSFVFHGLGSLVSGYIASPLEREGLIVAAGFDAHGNLVNVEVRPVSIAAEGIGRVPSIADTKTILQRFESLSAEIADGSFERRFYEEMSPGLVRLYTRDVRASFRQAGVSGLVRKALRIRLRHVKRLVHGLLPT